MTQLPGLYRFDQREAGDFHFHHSASVPDSVVRLERWLWLLVLVPE
jgi:hypothetical protein